MNNKFKSFLVKAGKQCWDVIRRIEKNFFCSFSVEPFNNHQKFDKCLQDIFLLK